MSASHLHSCPRCLGVESCSSAACLMRADLSEVEMFGDPRRCAPCRRAGRSFTAAEVAAAAGCRSADAAAAAKRGDVDLGSLSSVARWIEQRKAELGSHAAAGLQASLRELRLAGGCAQDLGFGVFMWLPSGGGYLYAGELAGPLKELALSKSRSVVRLPLPPFSALLAQLWKRCETGPGYDAESAALRRRLGEVVGQDDPVLCRLQVRAARRNK